MSDPSININNVDPAHVTLSGIIPEGCRPPRGPLWFFATAVVVNGTTYYVELNVQFDNTTGDIAIYLTDGTAAQEWFPVPSLHPLYFAINSFGYSLM